MADPRFACALSTAPDSRTAEREALARLELELDGAIPDLVVAFATHHHGSALEELGPRLVRALGATQLFGCTAESVIAGEEEAEGCPGLALWAACLPGTDVRFFEARAFAGEDGEPSIDRLPPIGVPEDCSVLLVADPFSFPVDTFLASLNERFAGVPVMGGMASGALGPGQSLLFTADGVREAGAVGVVLEGGVELRPVVSQGCRPVGSSWVVTECERNLVKKLGGRPALEVLMETWNRLAPADRELMQSQPFVGLAIDATKSRFERGDFLVRGVLGLHQANRSIAVADFVRRGQSIQFLVRDAASAGEDLRYLLESQGGGPVPGAAEAPRAGALLFSCNGRGSRMFTTPHHDVGCVRSGLTGNIPVAGFFAAGEIGPVGGRNFLHGFTASVAVFRPKTP